MLSSLFRSCLFLFAVLAFDSAQAANRHWTLLPSEDTNAVLHNPDMGWVVYENYPIDPTPGGSSTLVTMPGDPFPEADAVAIMFSWADIETTPDHYDFTNVDFAYDYWKKFGKEIQLRMSTEPLMLHVPEKPLAGTGVPGYVLAKLSPAEKETRHMDAEPYICVDARNPFYQDRLKKFLQAVNRHFDRSRPVTIIDLRGFGAWGEWHSGFHYPSLAARRIALKRVIEIWSATLPNHSLALSFSYDPDSPKSYYAGPYNKLAPEFTTNYLDFLKFSAFDYALTNPTITWRRDGCGGAVHSNERKLNNEAFMKHHQAPIVSEFLGSYSAIKKGGSNWVTFAVNDALSIHPNYLNFIGWQAGEARYFCTDRPDLLAYGSKNMGYRFVPERVEGEWSRNHRTLDVTITWVNQGQGRALRDYQVILKLFAGAAGGALRLNEPLAISKHPFATSTWVKGTHYITTHRLKLSREVEQKAFHLGLEMLDPASERSIELPLKERMGTTYLPGGFGEE